MNVSKENFPRRRSCNQQSTEIEEIVEEPMGHLEPHLQILATVEVARHLPWHILVITRLGLDQARDHHPQEKRYVVRSSFLEGSAIQIPHPFVSLFEFLYQTPMEHRQRGRGRVRERGCTFFPVEDRFHKWDVTDTAAVYKLHGRLIVETIIDDHHKLNLKSFYFRATSLQQFTEIMESRCFILLTQSTDLLPITLENGRSVPTWNDAFPPPTRHRRLHPSKNSPAEVNGTLDHITMFRGLTSRYKLHQKVQ